MKWGRGWVLVDGQIHKVDEPCELPCGLVDHRSDGGKKV